MTEAGRIISTYVYTAVQNKQIKDLLIISEEAKKEAQNKAEELQKANERLEEQQQLLQQQTEELQQTNAQLEEQHQQLEQQSHLLELQNQNLMKSREELAKRTKELELSDEYKSEFLANMSHELRTPLNSIVLLSKLLTRNDNKNLCEKDLEKASIIYKAGNELLRLVNGLMIFWTSPKLSREE